MRRRWCHRVPESPRFRTVTGSPKSLKPETAAATTAGDRLVTWFVQLEPARPVHEARLHDYLLTLVDGLMRLLQGYTTVENVNVHWYPRAKRVEGDA